MAALRVLKLFVSTDTPTMVFSTRFAGVAAVAAVALTAASAMEPICYEDGERAIGAPGYPYVKYRPCCSGKNPVAVEDDYGLFCPAGEKMEPTKCAGEEGYPYVEYVDCGYGYTCEKVPENGWGMFCVADKKTSMCYKTGERAIGAGDKPFVRYMPCCSGAMPVGRKYDWGLFCPEVEYNFSEQTGALKAHKPMRKGQEDVEPMETPQSFSYKY